MVEMRSGGSSISSWRGKFMLDSLKIVVFAMYVTLAACVGVNVVAPTTASVSPVPSQAPAGNPAPIGTPPAVSPQPAAAHAPTPSQLFAGGIFVNPTSTAAQQARRLTSVGETASASLVKQISSQPTAIWVGDWFTTAQLRTVLAADLVAARNTRTTATFVTYAIPGRDCGGYSAGGLTDARYLAWNAAVARELEGSHSVVIVEPDAVAMLATASCARFTAARPILLKSAVDTLVRAGLTVYLDAGNSRWISPSKMAPLLLASGVADARGFATNVANFNSTSDEIAYAQQISGLVGDTRYVIDTSRNGADRSHVLGWCNPIGAAIGQTPSVADGNTRLDALLWIKPPGASDGTCNGGPVAGQWWLNNALALVSRRGA
jgi:endoglucanase